MSPEEARKFRHELRTPVNHLIGYAELLLEEEPATELAAGLESIRAAARHVLELLPGLLGEDGDREGRFIELGQLAAKICETAERLREGAPAAAAADLDKIAVAATRLSELAGSAGSEAKPGSVATPVLESAHASLANILVVDDDRENRDVLGRRLRRLGYSVVEAEDGLEALARLAEGGVDLVLLDVMMPRLDGIGVLERVHESNVARHVPIIMISALDDVESVVHCIELGAEDYLPKPFDPVLLRARISASLEKKRLHDAEHSLLEQVQEQAAELARWNAELESRVKVEVEAAVRLRRLQRFLSPQVAEAILDGSAHLLESHRREVTVLFCDLRGFTSFSETSEPEDVMTVLRELHAEVGPRVFAHEGTIVHFTGDGMMVLFNDPLPCVGHAAAAVSLAGEMRAIVAGLAERWNGRGFQLGMGIGIASGFATCGSVGFEGRYEYTAIGTVCNLASRLCSEADDGQVLLNARTHTLLDGEHPSTLAGELQMKGLARAVQAYEMD